MSACRDLEVEGVKRKGRSRKSWEECVRKDLTSLGLKRDWALDRVRWRGCICGNRPTHASMDKMDVRYNVDDDDGNDDIHFSS